MATYYIGSMPVGSSLAHYRPEGSMNKKHSYIEKIPTGGGKFRYVYERDKTPRTEFRATGRSSMTSGAGVATAARRTGRRTQGTRMATSGASVGALAGRAPAYSAERGHAAARRQALNRSGFEKAAFRASMYIGATINEIKRQAAAARDWATKKIDWASKQVSNGLSAAHTFISNLLKKIGSSVKWGVSKAKIAAANAAVTVRNQANYAGYKIGNAANRVGVNTSRMLNDTLSSLNKKRKGSA